MVEKLKQLIWISSGGLAVGILIRRGNDAVRGIPNLSDTPLIDSDTLVFGSCLVLAWLWTMLTVKAFQKHRAWREAKEHWQRCYPSGGHFKWLFVLIRWQNTVATYLGIYFIVGLLGATALTSGSVLDTVKAFSGWFLLVLFYWFLLLGQEKKWFSIGSVGDPEADAVTLLDLPEQPGKFILACLLTVFLFGAGGYRHISQNFGGGRPETVIVFLKTETGITSNLKRDIDGRLITLMFRRGTKWGFYLPGATKNQFIVIDESQIDRLYVGKQVQELDPTRL